MLLFSASGRQSRSGRRGLPRMKGHSCLGCFLSLVFFPKAPSWRIRPRFEHSRLWP